jgi:hypothetical protein
MRNPVLGEQLEALKKNNQVGEINSIYIQMEQQIDLAIFLLSNTIFIFYFILLFRHNSNKTLFLNLSRKKLITLTSIEIILFIGMYFNYQLHKSPEIADSFSWHYSIIYARGVLPLAGLMSINDRIFNFRDPVFSCLLAGLLVDYLLLFLGTRIADLIKKKLIMKKQVG